MGIFAFVIWWPIGQGNGPDIGKWGYDYWFDNVDPLIGAANQKWDLAEEFA